MFSPQSRTPHTHLILVGFIFVVIPKKINLIKSENSKTSALTCFSFMNPWLSNTFWWAIFSQTTSVQHFQSEWEVKSLTLSPLSPLSSTEGRRREAEALPSWLDLHGGEVMSQRGLHIDHWRVRSAQIRADSWRGGLVGKYYTHVLWRCFIPPRPSDQQHCQLMPLRGGEGGTQSCSLVATGRCTVGAFLVFGNPKWTPDLRGGSISSQDDLALTQEQTVLSVSAALLLWSKGSSFSFFLFTSALTKIIYGFFFCGHINRPYIITALTSHLTSGHSNRLHDDVWGSSAQSLFLKQFCHLSCRTHLQPALCWRQHTWSWMSPNLWLFFTFKKCTCSSDSTENKYVGLM